MQKKTNEKCENADNGSEKLEITVALLFELDKTAMLSNCTDVYLTVFSRSKACKGSEAAPYSKIRNHEQRWFLLAALRP